MDLFALKALSLVINLAHNDPSLVRHLADWTDYAWAQMPLNRCAAADSCAMPRQRWDWHRHQWVDFSFRPPVDGQSIVTLTLTDDDPADDDDVCVTAAFLGADQNPIMVLHQNWHISPGQTISRQFSLSAPTGSAVAKSVVIGTKQCRLGAHEDDGVYRNALNRLGEMPPRQL